MLGRIVDTLGLPPDWMLETARHANKFFKQRGGDAAAGSGGGGGGHVLLSREEFEAHNGVPVGGGA